MKLEKLIAKDFLTYQNLEYDFVNKPLLVQGRNLTDDGQASNGSGKSGLQTMIEFCITASNSRGVRDNELISYGEKESEVQLIASCDVRKERIHISWTIKLKGSNKLTIVKQKYNGDWEEVSFSNLNDGKKWITNWFDISKEDLFNYFLINKARFKSFFESSNKEKVDLINRFSDASIIEGLEDLDIEELQGKFNHLEREEIRVQTRIEVKMDQLFEEKSRDLVEEFAEQVEDLNEDVQALEGNIKSMAEGIKEKEGSIGDLNLHNQDLLLDIKDDLVGLSLMTKDIEEHQKETESIEKDLKAIQTLVDEFKGLDKAGEKEELRDEVDDSEDQVRGYDDSIDEYENKKEQVLSLIQQINVKLSGTITCPSCEHDFILEGDIDELQEKKKSAESIIVKIENKIASSIAAQKILNDDIVTFYESIKELKLQEEKSLEGKSVFLKDLNEIRTKLSNHETKTRRLNKEYERASDDIKDLEKSIEDNKNSIKYSKGLIKLNVETIESYKIQLISIEAQIKALKPISNKSDISLLQKEVKVLEDSKITLIKEKSVIGDEIYKINQWKVNFKQFRLHLANQSLEVIEYHSNRYLTEMGSDLKVKLEGYKTLASGAVKDEITTKIIRNVERSFSSFSGGEKGRLLFASILANRYMINSTHKYGGLDFLSIDEVFEGVDSVGLKSLIKSAKDLGIAVMIITHVTDENVNDDILLIEKINGESIIKN
tara:strand:+ start:1126 stop:3276 length:2151 start_codon:yes stop_codon:yes gene_type:complete